MLVICGSVNPITLSQLDEAEQNGFVRLRLTPEEKLTDHYWETPAGQEKLKAMTEAVSRSDCIIIDTNDADGNRSTRQYAEQRQMKVEEMQAVHRGFHRPDSQIPHRGGWTRRKRAPAAP